MPLPLDTPVALVTLRAVGLRIMTVHRRQTDAAWHAGQRCWELVRDAQPPAMMITVDDDSGSAIALAGGWQHRERCLEG